MAIDMDAILADVKAEIAKANPPAPVPAKPAKVAKPAAAAKPAKPAAAEAATEGEEEDVTAEDFRGDGGGEVPVPGGKKRMHNFSKGFAKKYGPEPGVEAEEEA